MRLLQLASVLDRLSHSATYIMGLTNRKYASARLTPGKKSTYPGFFQLQFKDPHTGIVIRRIKRTVYFAWRLLQPIKK